MKTDNDLTSLKKTIKESDILILCVPHKKYKKLNLKNKDLIDIWGYTNK